MLTAPLEAPLTPAPLEVEGELAQLLLDALEEARQAGACVPEPEQALREAVGQLARSVLTDRQTLTRQRR